MTRDCISDIKKQTVENFPVFTEGSFVARVLDPDDSNDLRLFQEFRYKYWVEKFRYVDAADSNQRIEHDIYDKHSVHFGVLDENGRLIGYSRFILPSTAGLQIHREFEDLVNPHLEPAADMARSVETSRLIVAGELGARRHLVAELLYKLKYHFMKRHGFKYWYHVSEKRLIRALNMQKFPFKIIGEGKNYQGAICYPAILDFDDIDAILKEHRPDFFSWLHEGLEDNDYRELVSRNLAFIGKDVQERVKTKRLFFAGCGLGSTVAQLAARHGFTQFIVADFDTVEISNLNRQSFRKEDVGKNKAKVVGGLLKDINPKASVDVITERLTNENIKDAISSADIIINTVDFDSTNYAINDIAIAQGKPVFFPMNVGFGGFLLVFTDQTVRLQEMTNNATGNVAFIRGLANSVKGYHIPYYTLPLLADFDDYEHAIPLPQTGIAANITASITVLSMIGYIAGWPLRLAPNAIASDAMFATQPAAFKINTGARAKKAPKKPGHSLAKSPVKILD